MTAANPDRVVIVGGGIAGVSTAAALRSGGYAGEVVLVDRGPFPYDRPPLSKDHLAGATDLAGLALQPPEWYADQQVELLSDCDVTAVRPAADSVAVRLVRGVTRDGGEADDVRDLTADVVVLATGGRAAVPPVPGIDSRRVHVLREAADAERLRAALGPGRRLLVVGGGLVGAEVASTARAAGTDVVLTDPLDPPLAGAVGPEVARWLHEQHAAYGIETLGASLEALQDTPTGVAVQLTGEPRSREFDAVLLGVGMVPDTALAEAAGLEVDRGVLVDERQVTSHPRVLAVGDAARLRGRPRTEHWEAAQHDGHRAAATILGASPPAPTAPWFWTDRHGRHVEAVGEMRAADATHTVVVRGRVGDERFSVFTLRGDLVVGAVAVDDSVAVRAARRLIDRRVSVDADRLADPATDLRRLVRG